MAKTCQDYGPNAYGQLKLSTVVSGCALYAYIWHHAHMICAYAAVMLDCDEAKQSG